MTLSHVLQSAYILRTAILTRFLVVLDPASKELRAIRATTRGSSTKVLAIKALDLWASRDWVCRDQRNASLLLPDLLNLIWKKQRKELDLALTIGEVMLPIAKCVTRRDTTGQASVLVVIIGKCILTLPRAK